MLTTSTPAKDGTHFFIVAQMVADEGHLLKPAGRPETQLCHALLLYRMRDISMAEYEEPPPPAKKARMELPDTTADTQPKRLLGLGKVIIVMAPHHCPSNLT